MHRYQYSLSNFHDFLQGLSQTLGRTVSDNTLYFSEDMGQGYMKCVDLPNGLQALVGDFILKRDFMISREKSDLEFYVFVCDQIANNTHSRIVIDEDQIVDRADSLSRMYLLSFLSDLTQYARANTKVRTLRVILPKEWLAKYLRIDELTEVLRRYLDLKAKSIHVKDIDFESARLINEIFAPETPIPMEEAYIQNRVMLLLENFFQWMYGQLAMTQLHVRMTREEIDVMRNVEKELLGNLANPPTINELARLAAMSPSKLKRQFKDVFGQPVYEYYQRHRMNLARNLLLEGGRTIRDIGRELGFQNMSNFSLAFKKAHGTLPSEMLKIKE